MSLTTILFHRENCYKSQIIELINKYSGNKLEKVNIDTLSKENQEKVLSKSITGHFPLLQKGDFFLSETKAIIGFLLSSSKEISEILLKSNNPFEQSQVEMWIDFTKSNIWVLLEGLFITKGGITNNPDANVFQEAEKEMKNVLLIINKHLSHRTYIISDSLSLADLFIAVSLKDIFSKVLKQEDLKALNYLTRWFKLISHIKEFKELLGEVKLN